MTVLLIDGAGHVREWEISTLVPSLFVPIPTTTLVRVDDGHAPTSCPIAQFDYSDEPSFPPVYRYVGRR